MKAFLGLIIGGFAGFWSVPIYVVSQGTEATAFHGALMILLALICGTWGLMIGKDSANKTPARK